MTTSSISPLGRTAANSRPARGEAAAVLDGTSASAAAPNLVNIADLAERQALHNASSVAGSYEMGAAAFGEDSRPRGIIKQPSKKLATSMPGGPQTFAGDEIRNKKNSARARLMIPPGEKRPEDEEEEKTGDSGNKLTNLGKMSLKLKKLSARAGAAFSAVERTSNATERSIASGRSAKPRNYGATAPQGTKPSRVFSWMVAVKSKYLSQNSFAVSQLHGDREPRRVGFGRRSVVAEYQVDGEMKAVKGQKRKRRKSEDGEQSDSSTGSLNGPGRPLNRADRRYMDMLCNPAARRRGLTLQLSKQLFNLHPMSRAFAAAAELALHAPFQCYLEREAWLRESLAALLEMTPEEVAACRAEWSYLSSCMQDFKEADARGAA